jgi:hypothetical protein
MLEQTVNNLKKLLEIYEVIHNVQYIVNDNAPQTFKAVKQWFNKYGYLNIYSGGDHGLLGFKHNVLFRAIHDSMHIKHNLGFNKKDELKLSKITEQVFYELALAWGLSEYEALNIRKLINIEISGQIEYYYKYNKYVDDQTAYTINAWGATC